MDAIENAQGAKVCLTTYIYGEKYQGYIPFLVYSCHKAYPEYDIVLFLHEKMSLSVKESLDIIGAANVIIKENAFADCPHMNSLKAKCLRWVLWDDVFCQYDYLYVVDIDMLYIREPILLHEQHCRHMSTTGLCYDNLVRIKTRHPFRRISFGQRFKHAGFRSFFKFLLGSRKDYRLSGLHFIQVKPYYEKLTKETRDQLRKKIYDGSYQRLFMSCNNETFLYYMVKEYGMTPERLAVQSDPCKSLDFNDCTRPEFRPHHGIHLGIFRTDMHGKNDAILDSQVYDFYIQSFKKEIVTDSVYWALYDQAMPEIQALFENFHDYFQIQRP